MVAVTLGALIHERIGTAVVIELKDETAIEGTIVSTDPKSLNIELTKVVVYRRRIKNLKPENLESLFIKGKYIRFIHFDNYPSVLNSLKKSLRKK